MARTWQTDEVIRWLLEADLDEITDIIEEAEEDGEDAAEAIKEWVREGNAPKGLYDAVMRFTTAPGQAFDPVDWEAVVRRIKKEAQLSCALASSSGGSVSTSHRSLFDHLLLEHVVDLLASNWGTGEQIHVEIHNFYEFGNSKRSVLPICQNTSLIVVTRL